MSSDQQLPIEYLQPFLDRVSRRRAGKKTDKGPVWAQWAFDDDVAHKHLNGGPVYGACPITPGGWTLRAAALDLDSHRGECPPERMAETALRICSTAELVGLRAIAFRSPGGKGMHLWFLWDTDQNARDVRRQLVEVLEACGLRVGDGGVAAGQVEIFPKQDKVPKTGWGSWIALPYGGQSVPLDAQMQPLPRATPPAIAISDPVPHLPEPERVAPSAGATPPEFARVESALAAIPNDLDYERWFALMLATHAATGGSAEGLALFLQFSAKNVKYEPDITEYKWNSIGEREGGITEATLFARARQAGWDAARPEDFPDLEAQDAAAAQAAGQPIKLPRFYAHSLDEMRAKPEPEWMIYGVLPKAELGMLYGEPGAGKSFLVLDMCFALARGLPDWFGYRIAKPRRVCYVCAEGSGGFKHRLAAYELHNQIAPAVAATLPLHTITDAPNLLAKQPDTKDLLKQIMRPGVPDVIVFDTFSRTMPGGNENTSEDVGAVLAQCKRIHEATRALVLLVHHSGKDATRGSRGWSGTKGAVDTELEVLKDPRTLVITKQKDGREGQRHGYQLLDVTLGLDAYGEAYGSCVVVPSANAGAAPAVRRGPRGAPGVALRVIQELTALAPCPEQEALDAIVEALPETKDSKGFDRRKFLARRAVLSLVGDGFVVVRGGKIEVQ